MKFDIESQSHQVISDSRYKVNAKDNLALQSYVHGQARKLKLSFKAREVYARDLMLLTIINCIQQCTRAVQTLTKNKATVLPKSGTKPRAKVEGNVYFVWIYYVTTTMSNKYFRELPR